MAMILTCIVMDSLAAPLSLTPHHAKYFAHDLTRRASSGMDRLSMALFDAAFTEGLIEAEEIDILQRLATSARSIGTDTKTRVTLEEQQEIFKLLQP